MSCQDMSHDGNQVHGGTSRGPAFNGHGDKDIGAGVIRSCVSVGVGRTVTKHPRPGVSRAAPLPNAVQSDPPGWFSLRHVDPKGSELAILRVQSRWWAAADEITDGVEAVAG